MQFGYDFFYYNQTDVKLFIYNISYGTNLNIIASFHR